jgi:hypothetical protein
MLSHDSGGGQALQGSERMESDCRTICIMRRASGAHEKGPTRLGSYRCLPQRSDVKERPGAEAVSPGYKEKPTLGPPPAVVRRPHRRSLEWVPYASLVPPVEFVSAIACLEPPGGDSTRRAGLLSSEIVNAHGQSSAAAISDAAQWSSPMMAMACPCLRNSTASSILRP